MFEVKLVVKSPCSIHRLTLMPNYAILGYQLRKQKELHYVDLPIRVF